jgi:serine/threonine protein kinase
LLTGESTYLFPIAKPANVLVSEVDGQPVPKVIDFGIAKAAESSPDRTSVTQDTQLVGTPLYMAPEQAEPGAADVDTRADVYSLGWLVKATGEKVRQLADGEVVRMASHHVIWQPSNEKQEWDIIRRILTELETTPASRVAALNR